MKIKSNTSLSLRKLILSALVVAPLATLPAPLWAIPQVTGYTGNNTAANVTSNSTTTTFTYAPVPTPPPPFPITSSSLQITDTTANRLVLKWVEFGSGFSPISTTDSINWTLPSATSAVLNLVTGTGASLIQGDLTSNGTIYIVNPNGITLTTDVSVSAAGFGLSTVPQNEFYFLANGTLDPSTTALAAVTGVAPLPAAPDVSSAATINVGTTGNVVMSARNVSVSGTITAGTLTLNSNLSGSTRLAQSAALTLGTVGTAATGTADAIPGTGNLIINSNGGPVVLSGTGLATTVRRNLTIDSAGGSVTQGTGTVLLGDTIGNPALAITAGVGTIDLGTTGTLDVNGGADNRVDVTITSAGNSALRVVDGIRLMASTITGTLSLTSTAQGIAASGSSTVSGAVTLSNATAEKDMTFNAVGDVTFAAITSNVHANSDITLVSGGSIVLPSITMGGNLTVTAANSISQTAGTAILQPSTNKRAKFQATTGSITLDNQTGGGVALNDFSRVQLVGAPGGVTLRDLDDVVIHDGTDVTGTVVINAAAVIFGSDADAENTFNGSLTINGSAAGGLTLTSGGTGYTSAPTFTLMDGATVIGSGTTSLGVTAGTTSVPIATAGAGYTSAPTVTIGTGGAAASASLRLDVLPVTVGGTGYVAGNTFIVSGGGATTPAIVTVATVDPVTGAITGLNVTQGGAGFTDLSTVAVTPATVAGTGATFGTGTGSLTAINITSGGSYTTLPATATLVGGGATTAATTNQPTGSVATLTLTAPPSTFVAAPTVAFSAGTATATAIGGGVYDNSNNVTVIGLTQINTGAPVVIDGGANGSAIGLNHHFGQINVNQGASAAGITLYEQTTLNLGAITTAGKLRAYSSGGDVIDVGPLVAGSAEFGAGTATAPGSIMIDSAGTTITGNIAFLDDVSLVTNVPAGTGSVIGTYLARDVTISTAGTVNIAPTISGITGLGILGNMTLSSTGTGSDIVFAGAVGVGGLLTLNSADAITANNSDNSILTATVTAGGIVNLRSTETMTINATLTQNAVGNTATFAGDGLRIGTVNSDYTGLVTFQSRGDNTLTDNVNGMRVFGPVNFTGEQSITINNTGHSFGLVSASTTNRNGSITIVESGGLRLGSIDTNGRGNFTATSTTGDILQDITLGGIRLRNGEIGTGTFSAPLGSITLNDNDTTGGTNRMAIINATAGGSVDIANPRVGAVGQTVLGNITAGGSLYVDSATNITGAVVNPPIVNSIEQSSSGRINSFSVTTFVSTGAGAITIGNTGNRMGGVVAVTDTGNITLTESPTLHLLNVRTAGALFATSETGSIIDSAFYATGSIGTAATPINATFSAPRGGVTLGLGTSNYGTVAFTTGGNVSILDSAGNISFATSTIGGTLDVIATAGNINQTGPLTVNGNVTLTANAGGIDFSNTSNMFGGVRFLVGAAGALIAENTTFNLRGGSVSQGPVQLVTNGDFITSGVGASSITNNLTIQAQGTIIPGAGSLLVTGVFTVFSPSLKDLSALSKSGNLTNRDPINLGSGPFVPPSL